MSLWSCEPVGSSAFLGRSFDAAVAVALLFLLPEEEQRTVRRLIETPLPGVPRPE